MVKNYFRSYGIYKFEVTGHTYHEFWYNWKKFSCNL